MYCFLLVILNSVRSRLTRAPRVWCGNCALAVPAFWVALRLDSTLRLYHADTGEHLQDLDVAPFMARVLGSERLLVRIGAIAIAYSRLWIGTSSGVVLSVPFHQSTVQYSITVNSITSILNLLFQV